MTTLGGYELRKQATLSNADVAAIEQLVVQCNAAENMTMRLNWDMLRNRPGKEIDDYLVWDGAELIGYLPLYGWGRTELETSGMIAPAYRRQGLFTELFHQAQADAQARGIARLLIFVQHEAASGQAWVRSIGSEYRFSEHAMVWEGPLPTLSHPAPLTIRPATPADAAVRARILHAGFGSPEDVMQTNLEQEPVEPGRESFLIELDNKAIGQIGVHSSAEGAYIFGFVMLEAYRGKGYGRQVLVHTVANLLAAGQHPITLEVEATNDHALGLYLRCGFRRVHTYDYFEVALEPSAAA